MFDVSKSPNIGGLFENLKNLSVFEFSTSTYNVPEEPSANPYGEARSAEFTDGWMDGWMGWDGMGWGIKSVLQFSLYFVCI